jgi:hypothetical protein
VDVSFVVKNMALQAYRFTGRRVMLGSTLLKQNKQKK